jgi:hypothetical protein
VFASEGTGKTLALLTWFVFGATVIGQSFQRFTWEMLVDEFGRPGETPES